MQRKAPKRRLDGTNEYTVGIITALAHEKAAVMAMLDEQHDVPREYSQAKHDDNSYSWGSMSGHNVAVVSLGAGSYGTTQSAHTVAPMISSLPEMRFGLLVGIGAGIPQDGCDIRLGDVAISIPGSGSGGVYQYDALKAKLNHELEQTGLLNKPSDILLKAVEHLQSRHLMEDSAVPDYLHSMAETWPKMARSTATKPSFLHQGSVNDLLFPVDYHHVHSEKTCAKCDSTMASQRAPRETLDPEFHYGVIASGNTLVKDSVHRDELVKRIPGCICFEMEAAGVMNKLPCLVIRGICDYADSHKNDLWQNYAAAVAAGYAKELLSVITPVAVERSKPVSAVVVDIKTELARIESIAEKAEQESRRKNVVDWLAHPDTSKAHRKARDLHQPGTCDWFLASETLIKWKEGRFPLIWVHGIPGSGKTILSSSIIDKLELETQDPGELVLYFYFEYTTTTNVSFDGMVRNFAARMFLKNEKTEETLQHFYDHNKSGLPSTEDLVETFESMVSQFNRVYIVIDALDEVKHRGDLLKLLSWIKATANVLEGRIQLIVTSRREEDIESSLSNMGETVVLLREVVEDDIKSYVDEQIREDPDFEKWKKSTEVQNAIKTALIEKSQGMFRWVVCQMDALRTCYSYEDLLEALATLPQTLEGTYTRILDGITSKKQRQRAITILRLLLFYEDTLSTDIVLDAIIVNPLQDPAFDPVNRFPNPRDLARLCGALISIDWNPDLDWDSDLEPPGVIRIAHFSVREYLTSNQVPQDFKDAFKQSVTNSSFTQISLGYLRHIPTSLDYFTTMKEFPLARFAMKWPTFARDLQREENVARAIAKFFTKDAYHSFVRLSNPWDNLKYHECTQNEDVSDPLWILSSLELNDSLAIAASKTDMSCLLNDSPRRLDLGYLKPIFPEFDPRARWYGGGFPSTTRGSQPYVKGLYLAALNGWSSIVKAILSHDTESHIQGGPYGTALNAAMYFDKTDVVNIIQAHYDTLEPEKFNSAILNTLKCGAEFWKPVYFDTWLQKAMTRITPAEKNFHDVLRAALLYGNQDLVDLSLEKNHPIQSMEIIGHSFVDALKFCEESCAETIMCILDNSRWCQPGEDHPGPATKALIETLDEQYCRTALHWAAERGFTSVTKALLLRHGDIHRKDKFGETPLHRAAQWGRTQTAQVLVDQGAGLTEIDGCLRTPLLSALLNSHLDTCWAVSPTRLGNPSFQNLLDEIDSETGLNDIKTQPSSSLTLDRFFGELSGFKQRIRCDYPNAERFLRKPLNIIRFRQLIKLELQLAEDDSLFLHAIRLHDAILSGKCESVRTALHGSHTQRVVNSRYAEQNMSTPLHIAAEGSFYIAFHDLLHAGADPKLENLCCDTPIHALAHSTWIRRQKTEALKQVIRLPPKLDELAVTPSDWEVTNSLKD